VGPAGPIGPVGPCGPLAPVAPLSPLGPCGPAAPLAPVGTLCSSRSLWTNRSCGASIALGPLLDRLLRCRPFAPCRTLWFPCSPAGPGRSFVGPRDQGGPRRSRRSSEQSYRPHCSRESRCCSSLLVHNRIPFTTPTLFSDAKVISDRHGPHPSAHESVLGV